jgi:short subunit dehydrogenase-like uncharacterized protein
VALADLATGHYSTGIRTISAWFPAGPAARVGLRLANGLAGVISSRPVRRLVVRRLARLPAGPTDAQRLASSATLLARVTDAAGRSAVSRLVTPEAYTTTALGLLEMVQRLLAGPVTAGFHTVSAAFGADCILGIPGVSREDL